MNKRALKDLLYDQVARIGRAVSSPKRLELLELLAQGEKTVETLSIELSVDVKLASAHLKALREVRLVTSRRDGKYVLYRMDGDDVSNLFVALRKVAEERLLELQHALNRFVKCPQPLDPVDRRTLLLRVRRGEVVLIDVRPADEYEAAHIPHARSVPLAEIESCLSELPSDKEIVAYCRGPFCLFSAEAVSLLQRKGFRARQLPDGINEWRASGLPLARADCHGSKDGKGVRA